MAKKLKTAKQFVKAHSEWFELYQRDEATLDESPKGKEYNLKGADLSYTNLKNANFVGANLKNANLFGANLKNANLFGASLRGADLENASLVVANLHEAILSGATLYHAKFCKSQVDTKWKDYIKTQNVYYFYNIKWIEDKSNKLDKLYKYMKLAEVLKSKGLSNDEILEVIDKLD